MTEFLERLATLVINSDGYKEESGHLFGAYVEGLSGPSDKFERKQVKKLITSAQIFYRSQDKNIRNEGEALLSMILDMCGSHYPDVIHIAYSMFVNSGDFPNISLLEKKYPQEDFKYGFYSEAQMEFRQNLNTVDELDFPLTDFQRCLWEDPSTDQDVITSAPTSAGKTYIILNYLLHKLIESEGAFAAVVVPTRALISEVAGQVYELAKNASFEDDIEICTIPNKVGSYKSKTFFVMTQERLHEVLLSGDLTFNYLFIDEAQNIASSSRGVLLHLTIEKLLEDSFPQIIISMPSQSYQNSFSTVFKDVDFKKELTQRSPVAKVIMSVVPKGRDLILSRYNSSNVKVVNKGFKGKDLADIVYKLGAGQSNIIYRNRTDSCENIANKISELIKEVEENPQLEEAANYVEEFIHEEFSLAENLRKGVAFHYGPLPSSIRVMIENLAKDGQISFIACTSTLAEGVNLPAKNLFLQNPTQPVPYESAKRLDDVTVANITGRAGRMMQHFSGNIFLIEPEEWRFKDYFDEKSDEGDKIPTYFKSLNEEFDFIIQALNGSYEYDRKDQYKFYTIANKLIKEFATGNLENTLDAAELTIADEQKKLLSDNIELAHKKLKVTAFTLEANPTVGYIQQNGLFAFLDSQENLEEWILPHPQSPNAYTVLLRVCQKLREFGVYIPNDNYTLEQICLITGKWTRGETLKSVITDQIRWDVETSEKQNKSPSKVNKSVRDIIKVINNDIRFRLSNSLRCYQVLLTNILLSRGSELTSVKLHSFIELGACEERMINLINFGLSRETAKEIHDVLPTNEIINSSAMLLQLYRSGRLDGIHAVTKKEIKGLFS